MRSGAVCRVGAAKSEFLSIQAQDFIEDIARSHVTRLPIGFLSIQAQDFIEELDVWQSFQFDVNS